MNRLFFYVFIVFIAFSLSIIAGNPGGKAGAFSRMGFGARASGMGNAFSAVKSGNLVSYYNPASSIFQEGNSIQASYSILSLDRSLNYLSFTKKFEFGKDSLTGRPRGAIGFSAGIINSGVSGIEERDNEGMKKGDISVSENQFYISVSNKFSDKVAIGISCKYYYFDLYDDITSSALGLDAGIMYSLSENITLAGVIADLNSSYKWNTNSIYGNDGNEYEDKFPLMKRLAASYRNKELGLISVAEFENASGIGSVLKIGAEYTIIESFSIRCGLDRISISDKNRPVKFSAGFSFFRDLGWGIAGVDYAFVTEPYSSFDEHILGINLNL